MDGWIRGCIKDREKMVSMGDAVERPIVRRREIEAAGYQVVEMLGCDWEKYCILGKDQRHQAVS